MSSKRDYQDFLAKLTRFRFFDRAQDIFVEDLSKELDLPSDVICTALVTLMNACVFTLEDDLFVPNELFLGLLRRQPSEWLRDNLFGGILENPAFALEVAEVEAFALEVAEVEGGRLAPPEITPESPFVYLMASKKTGLFKIGFSINLNRRAKEVSKVLIPGVGDPGEVKVFSSFRVGDYAAARVIEKFLHETFASVRVSEDAEWFELDEKAINYFSSRKGWSASWSELEGLVFYEPSWFGIVRDWD